MLSRISQLFQRKRVDPPANDEVDHQRAALNAVRRDIHEVREQLSSLHRSLQSTIDAEQQLGEQLNCLMMETYDDYLALTTLSCLSLSSSSLSVTRPDWLDESGCIRLRNAEQTLQRVTCVSTAAAAEHNDDDSLSSSGSSEGNLDEEDDEAALDAKLESALRRDDDPQRCGEGRAAKPPNGAHCRGRSEEPIENNNDDKKKKQQSKRTVTKKATAYEVPRRLEGDRETNQLPFVCVSSEEEHEGSSSDDGEDPSPPLGGGAQVLSSTTCVAVEVLPQSTGGSDEPSPAPAAAPPSPTVEKKTFYLAALLPDDFTTPASYQYYQNCIGRMRLQQVLHREAQHAGGALHDVRIKREELESRLFERQCKLLHLEAFEVNAVEQLERFDRVNGNHGIGGVGGEEGRSTSSPVELRSNNNSYGSLA